MTKDNVSKLEEKLTLKKESSWYKTDKKTEKAIFKFCEDYKDFLKVAKTEREVVDEIVGIAKKNGFKHIEQFKTLKPGDKVIQVNKNRNVCLAVIGKNEFKNGFRLIASHIDSPRIPEAEAPLRRQGKRTGPVQDALLRWYQKIPVGEYTIGHSRSGRAL